MIYYIPFDVYTGPVTPFDIRDPRYVLKVSDSHDVDVILKHVSDQHVKSAIYIDGDTRLRIEYGGKIILMDGDGDVRIGKTIYEVSPATFLELSNYFKILAARNARLSGSQ